MFNIFANFTQLSPSHYHSRRSKVRAGGAGHYGRRYSHDNALNGTNNATMKWLLTISTTSPIVPVGNCSCKRIPTNQKLSFCPQAEHSSYIKVWHLKAQQWPRRRRSFSTILAAGHANCSWKKQVWR